MKYHIMSINDERLAKKDAIRGKMSELGVPKAPRINSVDGRIYTPKQLGISNVSSHLLLGEWGVWASNAAIMAGREYWGDDALLVFEDDAILQANFHMNWVEHLPDDWDFAAIWVPDNQRVDIIYNVQYAEDGAVIHVAPEDRTEYLIGNQFFAKAYNGYGGVAIAYSKQGAEKIHNYISSDAPLNEPYDTWLYTESHLGRLNGYSLKPSQQIVCYDWSMHVKTTQVHNTGIIGDLNE